MEYCPGPADVYAVATAPPTYSLPFDGRTQTQVLRSEVRQALSSHSIT